MIKRIFGAILVLALAAGCAEDREPTEEQRALGLDCLNDGNCNDGKGCTIDKCVLLGGGLLKCQNTPVADPLCCEGLSDCEVASGCQDVSCVITTNPWKDCVSEGSEGDGCCSTPEDCAPQTCHTSDCDGTNTCAYSPTPGEPGCCTAPSECPIGTNCQMRTCEDSTCGLKAREIFGCCTTVDECPPPADVPCPLAACVGNTCTTLSLCDAGVPDAPPPPPDAGPIDARPPDAHLPSDARPADARAPDAPIPDGAPPPPDAPVLPVDARPPDAPVPDGPELDAPPEPDAKEPDAREPDGGEPDAAEADGPVESVDAAPIDAPVASSDADDEDRLRGGGGCQTGGGGTAGLWIVLGALILLRRRHVVTLAALLALSSSVRAAEIPDESIDGQLFRPPATSGGVTGLDAAIVPGHLTATAAVFLAYTRDPLVILNDAGGRDVVSRQLDAQIAASVGLWHVLEVGVLVPVLLDQSTGAGVEGSAFGDLRLEAKLVPLRGGGASLGLVAGLGLPTGGDDAFYSDGGVSFRPRLVFTYATRRAELTAQAGLVFRPSHTNHDLEIGEQVSYGLGARVEIAAGFGLFAALNGVRLLSAADNMPASAGSPMELLGGPELRSRKLPLELALAVGRGLNDGYGSPSLRAVFQARYVPRPPVRIRQITIVEPPLRPAPPEPPPDGDADGVADAADRCPTEAGPSANNGCPWPDTDGDGLVDVIDKCPAVKGLKELEGCPDLDRDGDGLTDRTDKCPDEPEVFNGEADDDGCPDQGLELAVLTDKAIEIRQQVFFQLGSSVIHPRSFRLLATVAQLLKLHPEITLLRIEGHTDNHGGRQKNLALSQARAEAVRAHLMVLHDIEGKRLLAQGFGPDRPISDNRSEAGRARNRRSEFVIIERAAAGKESYSPAPSR